MQLDLRMKNITYKEVHNSIILDKKRMKYNSKLKYK